jgi:hypothetical protein
MTGSRNPGVGGPQAPSRLTSPAESSDGNNGGKIVYTDPHSYN